MTIKKVALWNKEKINAKNYAEVQHLEKTVFDNCSVSSEITLPEGVNEKALYDIFQAFEYETDIELEYEVLELHEAAEAQSIAIKWHIDDVKHVCPEATQEQCIEVIHYVKQTHDAEYGINWQTLEDTYNHLFCGKA